MYSIYSYDGNRVYGWIILLKKKTNFWHIQQWYISLPLEQSVGHFHKNNFWYIHSAGYGSWAACFMLLASYMIYNMTNSHIYCKYVVCLQFFVNHDILKSRKFNTKSNKNTLPM